MTQLHTQLGQGTTSPNSGHRQGAVFKVRRHVSILTPASQSQQVLVNFGNMLKAIGIGKNKPPKDSDIRHAREQAALLAQWRRDAGKLRAIVDKLQGAYTGAKGGFAVNRYEHIKNMIKEATESYKNVSQEIKDTKLSGSLSKMTDGSSLSGGGSVGGGSSVGGTLERQKKPGGLMARLKNSAQSFATHEDIGDDVRRFDDMTAKDLEAEMDSMRKEVLQLKGEFYAMRDKLEWLGQEYQASKKLNPTLRYPELKKMVKSVIRESYVPKKD